MLLNMMTTEPVITQIDPTLTIQLALQGDAEAVQRVIDLELDAMGIHRGFSDAGAFWLRLTAYRRSLAA